MLIYKDAISGDELFSDTYPITLTKDVLYEVVGKYETRKGDEVVLEGSNASAEEADEGTDEASVSGIDIVLNHQLTESGFGSKKEYQLYLKDYMKRVVKHLEENGKKDEVESFKTNIAAVMKDLLKDYKDLVFYVGESFNADAMYAICQYKEVNGEERPVVMFFKHGLIEEKC